MEVITRNDPEKVYMDLAIQTAYDGIYYGDGGPFGAIVMNPVTGYVCPMKHNTVLKDHSPTCHGEMNAIYAAGQELQTYNLQGYILYTTAYPCPMCLSAILWAHIDKVYYGCTREEVAKLGFADDLLYDKLHIDVEDLKSSDGGPFLQQFGHDSCKELFEAYMRQYHVLY